MDARPAQSIVAVLVSVGCLFCSTSMARAEQFIVTDVSYTHSGETTKDSHYHVTPLPGTPSSWKSPVDYSAGSVRVLLEVKTKPTDTPTQFQICFEGNPGYGCTDQSKPYTKTGTYEWTTKFSSFYLGNGGPDWSKGVSKVALILKDTNNGKPQGDPKYVPTDLHVQVAILSSGATFAPPVSPSADGGVGDVATKPARPDAGSAADASSGAPLPPPRDAATSTGEPKDAGTATPSKDASSPGPSPNQDAGTADRDGGAARGSSADKDQDTGCSVGSASWSGGLPVALALLLLALTSRRRSRLSRARASCDG